jgi:uncharacterized protein (TIGR02300 family)
LPDGVDGIATHIDEIEPMEVASASQSNKTARGIKRVCDACQVRFYDLLRDPIVCPSCGAQQTPMVQLEVGRRAPAAGKTGWRQHIKKPSPVLPDADAEIAVRREDAAGEELETATEDAAEAVADDDIVLEHEPDDADVSGLVDHDVEEPKER